MTGKHWTIFIFLMTTVFVLIGLGFAAMSTNPPFVVSAWVPNAFFIAAAIIFVIAIIFLIYSIKNNKNRKVQNISDSTRQSIRDYRQEFEEKRQILDKLLILDTYLGNQVKKQNFTGEDFFKICRSWLHISDYLEFIFLAIIYPFSVTRRIFTNKMINIILSISARFNSSLKELGLGTLVVVDNDEEYKRMYNEIVLLENGLPIYITFKINRFIFVSIALNALRISRDKKFWEEVYGKNAIYQRYLDFGKNNISLMLMPLDNSLTAIRSEIAQDIEKYFTVSGD